MHVQDRFSAVQMVDGTTLEGLRRKTRDADAAAGPVLGGRLLVIVDGWSLRPVWHLYEEDPQANDKRFADAVLAQVPGEGLLVYDMGFFSFAWFDAFTGSGRWFVTRMREKTGYMVEAVLGEGPMYRDRVIRVGLYRSNPCRHLLRLVEVRWNGVWHRYLTNVLDPGRLSAQDVCELYRRRWRIEEAFAQTKRLLDLAYLWTSSRNAVQLQVYATLVFYAVLLEVCHELADARVVVAAHREQPALPDLDDRGRHAPLLLVVAPAPDVGRKPRILERGLQVRQVGEPVPQPARHVGAVRLGHVDLLPRFGHAGLHDLEPAG